MKKTVLQFLFIFLVGCSFNFVSTNSAKNTSISTSPGISVNLTIFESTPFPSIQSLTTPTKIVLPVFSPKKCRIAFVSTRDGYNGIYSMNSEGLDITNLTEKYRDSSSEEINYPAWSRDGKLIAYYSDIGEKKGIHIKSVDDGKLVFQSTIEADSLDLMVWSSDSTKIAFRDSKSIYVLNLMDAKINRLTSRLPFEWVTVPSWSPDGSRIVFGGLINQKEHIYIINSDGSGLLDINIEGSSPVWSPDGRYIVFNTYEDGHTVISSIDPDGKNVRALTGKGNENQGFLPSISPDGQKIAFYKSVPEDAFAEDIYVMDSDGKNLHQLIGNKMEIVSGWRPMTPPSWSPDGSKIAFEVRKTWDDNLNIFIANIDGTNLKKLSKNTSPNVDDFMPTWLPVCK